MKKVLLMFLAFLFCPIFVLATGSVELNTATLAQLDQLTGVGPAIGQRIIDGRPYSSVDDLSKVKGIGEKTLQKIKDQGLAYIEPGFAPTPAPTAILPKPKKPATTTSVATENLNQATPNPWLLFIIAGAIAIISGLSFLLLKLTLFKNHERS